MPAFFVLLEKGARGLFEKNNFVGNGTGLGISLRDGGVADVRANTFSQNKLGFSGEGDLTGPEGPVNCLQLIGNRGKDEEGDFSLRNLSSPSSFKVSLSDNVGSLVVSDQPVSFAKKCPSAL